MIKRYDAVRPIGFAFIMGVLLLMISMPLNMGLKSANAQTEKAAEAAASKNATNSLFVKNITAALSAHPLKTIKFISKVNVKALPKIAAAAIAHPAKLKPADILQTKVKPAQFNAIKLAAKIKPLIAE